MIDGGGRRTADETSIDRRGGTYYRLEYRFVCCMRCFVLERRGTARVILCSVFSIFEYTHLPFRQWNFWFISIDISGDTVRTASLLFTLRNYSSAPVILTSLGMCGLGLE